MPTKDGWNALERDAENHRRCEGLLDDRSDSGVQKKSGLPECDDGGDRDSLYPGWHRESRTEEGDRDSGRPPIGVPGGDGGGTKGTDLKHDTGKPRLSLVPPGTATAIAEVMTQCIEREENPYSVNSWRHVRPGWRYLDALERHLEAVKAGGDMAEDTKLHHIKHLLTNAAILTWLVGQGESILPEDFNPGDLQSS